MGYIQHRDRLSTFFKNNSPIAMAKTQKVGAFQRYDVLRPSVGIGIHLVHDRVAIFSRNGFQGLDCGAGVRDGFHISYIAKCFINVKHVL